VRCPDAKDAKVTGLIKGKNDETYEQNTAPWLLPPFLIQMGPGFDCKYPVRIIELGCSQNGICPKTD